jgi:hypothetical protein
MKLERVDYIIKFALATASQEEEWDNRELGPIHLVKYVYLADLAYSEHHAGETFTNAPWRFHHFGPWSPEVFERIKPVIEETHAEERRISHPKYEDDFYRFRLEDEELYEQLYNTLPLAITTAIKNAIHSYGNDTSALLYYVYKTRPMLQSSPGENLDFGLPEREPDIEQKESSEATSPSTRSMSVKQKKQRKEKIANIKKVMDSRLSKRLSLKKQKPSYTPPRYDEIYFNGLEWLDSLAGDPIEPEEGTLEITEDIWKSPFRTDDALS